MHETDHLIYMRSYIRSYPMVLLLLLMVAAILVFDHFYPLTPQDEDEQKYGFIITSAPKATAKCDRFETECISGGKVYLYLLRDSTISLPTYGDTIVARTTISWHYGVGRAFAAQYLVLKGYPDKTPIQVRLYRRLQAGGLIADELSTVGALTLGYKDDIDPIVKHHFQSSGAAHVLAVSGLHTGIIYGILIWLLTLGGHFRPRYENRLARSIISLIIIAAMWFYAWLTGMTPSVVRAVLMVTLFELGRMLYRSSLTINTISSAAILILLARPTDLWSVSFQLSFAATTAIIIFVNAIDHQLHLSRLQKRKGGKITYWVLSLMIVSIAAQLGTLPITIYNFGQISTYFLLANLIVLPIASILVPCGLISIVLGGSSLGILWTKITWSLAWLMNHSVGWIESLPYSVVPASITPMLIVIYYILFAGLCISIQPMQKL